jgi:hypothetical protein
MAHATLSDDRDALQYCVTAWDNQPIAGLAISG